MVITSLLNTIMSDCTADVQYLVGLFCSTLGQDGENLGSDAADVISVCWVAVSVVEAKVIRLISITQLLAHL